MDAFTRAYIHAAAFTEDPDPGQGEYPERPIEDFDPIFLTQAIEDCAQFARAFEDLIDGDEEHAGRDFWYTRNGHGCGFWDGDWAEPAATILSAAAETFGEVYDSPFAPGVVAEDEDEDQ
jgi:hypothetical protein